MPVHYTRKRRRSTAPHRGAVRQRADASLPDAPDAAETMEEQVDDKADGAGPEDEEDQGEEQEPTEQEIEDWQAFRDEFAEVVEVLPTSLHRSYIILREQDDLVEAHYSELLPAINEYISFRKNLVQPEVPPPTLDASSQNTVLTTGDMTENAVGDRPTLVDPPQVNGHVCNGPSPAETPVEAPVPDGIVEVGVVQNPKKRKRSPLDDASSSGTLRSSTALHSKSPSRQSPHSPHCSKSAAVTVVNGLEESVAFPSQVVLSTGGSEIPTPPLATKSSSKLSEPARVTTKRMLNRIAYLANDAVRASDDKMGLARATYDLVDRHVRSLDAKIKEFEASLSIGIRPGSHALAGALTFGHHGIRDTVSMEPEEAPRVDSRSRKDRRADRRRATIKEDAEDAEEQEMPGAADIVLGAMNMPIVDAEPRYCYCHRVSFGEMIGCDGENCPYEWFHLECVEMSVPPKGTWYCRDCAPEHGRPPRKKRRH